MGSSARAILISPGKERMIETATSDFPYRRVVVTVGAGLLGRYGVVFQGGRHLERLSRRDERSLRMGEKYDPGAASALPPAIRRQYDIPVAGKSLWSG